MQYVPFNEVFCHTSVIISRVPYFMHLQALIQEMSVHACLVFCHALVTIPGFNVPCMRKTNAGDERARLPDLFCHALMEIPRVQRFMHTQSLMRETGAHACLVFCHALVPTICHLMHAQALMRERSAHACLMNALAVSEFLATFGVLCEASKLSLRELQQAASSLSSKSALAQLYSSLLRCVLLEKACSLPADFASMLHCCSAARHFAAAILQPVE